MTLVVLDVSKMTKHPVKLSTASSLWQKLASYLSCWNKNKDCQWDVVELDLEGLHISVRRKSTLDIPYEVSVYVPRAEIRKSYESGSLGANSSKSETILNSITIVHAPRHPLAGEGSKELKKPPVAKI